ncbi:hypothetical protein HNW13_007970 [Shewanella sp. BF02_Schw]|uniref:hypothetical protein n=1 Tax=Shewanella sp. BF02_Schw TaxID=394908 RepID=UPI00178329F2|nr:hypothetical protein [Shewanella sp. BF02_Schw]MBO1895711.1 hypothetical protein [Shewanella sp. BF02_Schw]
MKRRFVFIFLMMICAVSGCSSIPLTTMYKMMSVNPLELEPSEIVVAVQAPNGIVVSNNDVVIKFEFTTNDPNYNFEDEYFVKLNTQYVLPNELTQEINRDSKFYILQLSQNDTLKMLRGQELVKKYRMNNSDGGGSFNLSVESVCKNSQFSVKNNELNVFLKLNENDDFFTFMEDLNVLEIGEDKSGYIKPIRSCT